MFATLLLTAVLAQSAADLENFDCEGQCKQMEQMCAYGCAEEARAAKKNGEALPMDCKDMCGPAVERCKEMCGQVKQMKAKAKNMKIDDVDDDGPHDHGNH